MLESPYITWMAQEHLYASVNDLYGSGHLPDSLCAMALAWAASGINPAEDIAPAEIARIQREARTAVETAQRAGDTPPEDIVIETSPEAGHGIGSRFFSRGRRWIR